MRKAVLFVCLLILLLAPAGLASAAPALDSFTISGTSPHRVMSCTPIYLDENGCEEGTYFVKSQGDVSGYFDGTFTMKEWGTFTLSASVLPWPFSINGYELAGTNHGKLEIQTSDGKVFIRWEGTTTFFPGVLGSWEIHHGNGAYRGLEGGGMYYTPPVDPSPWEFKVQFDPFGP